MKLILCGCVLALVLGGCGSAPAPGRMTQPIVTESLDARVSSSAGETVSESAPSGAYDDAAGYYRAKAEEEALDADEEALEADYRVGKIDESAFRSEKSALKAREEQLELEKDRLKHAAKAALPVTEPPTGSMEELLEQLRELELQDDALEAEEDRLESDYRAEELTREEYVDQMAGLLTREEILDNQKDLLEDALEAMGWDDSLFSDTD